MKRILTFAILAACWVWVMASCATTVTRTVTTDKSGTVTDVTITSKAGDPAALALAGQIATAYAPRGMVVRQEKSDADMRKLLKGWSGGKRAALTGPITQEEIDTRWKP
jgi:hypothetical protein